MWSYAKGDFVKTKEPIFNPEERLLRYGDGFFETIKFSNRVPLHMHYHYSRMEKSFTLLKLNPKGKWSMGYFEQLLKEVALKNDTKDAVFRIVFYRESVGNYHPASKEASFFVNCIPQENALYPGITKEELGIFNELYKTSNFTSILKTTSANIYVLASIFAQENKLDDCLLLNEQGRISEAISSNVFMVLKNKIITPPISEYCVDGVMRKVVLELAKNYGYQCDEIIIEEQDLYSADEVFLTNTVNGITPVNSFRGKRYSRAYSDILQKMLNDTIE